MNRNIFWVFSGQGAQHPGMGRDLYDAFPAAKRRFDEAAQRLGDEFLATVFEGPAEKLTETRFCQPAIYTMSCALFDVFHEKFPAAGAVAAAGLSLGEYAALYAAGAVDFATGLELLRRRAAAMDEACHEFPGGMASVLKADPEVIRAACAEAGIDVANYNSPGQIVISGEHAKLARAIELLNARGVSRIIELQVAGAFHSRLMSEAGRRFAPALAEAAMRMPAIPVYHNFSAAPAADLAELRTLLEKQVSGSVRWEESLRRAAAEGALNVIEFGPGNVLTGLARRTLPELKLFNLNTKESIDNFSMEELAK